MGDIHELTFSICKSDADDSIIAQALEVWTSIAEEEDYWVERNLVTHDLIAKVFKDLLHEVVLNCFARIEFNDDMNDGEWGVGTSAQCCLRAIAKLMWNDILDPIIEYSGPLIVSHDLK